MMPIASDAAPLTLASDLAAVLHAAFGVPFEVCAATDTVRDRQESVQADACPVTNTQAADFAHTNPSWSIQREPLAKKIDAGMYRLFVPFSDAGAVRFAFADLQTEDPEQVIRTARLALSFVDAERLLNENRHRLGDTIGENEMLATQLSADFEELTFLRTIAEFTDIREDSSDPAMIAKDILPILNRSVAAQDLILLGGRLTEDERYLPLDPLVWVGTRDVAAKAVRRLVFDHADLAVHNPVVRNAIPESESNEKYAGVREFVLVPVSRARRFFGWIVAINVADSYSVLRNEFAREFGTSEASLLGTTATILANHLANIKLLDEREKLLVDVVRTLVSAIEAKDEYTRGHSDRVALYTRRAAEAIGCDKKACQDLYLTAILHDIGKIGVLDAVLKKNGKLTDEQFEHVQRHPSIGGEILGGLEALSHLFPGIIHHHERFDGQGYPDRLAGEEIPLAGRLVAVADAFDAMTSDRPYRQGMPSEKAVAILRDGAGTQWDPKIVEAFLAVIDDILAIRAEYEIERIQNEGDQS